MSLYLRKKNPPVGSRPGSITIAEDAMETKIHRISYDEKEIEEHDLNDLEELKEILADGLTDWIDVHGLGDEGALSALQEAFDIHPLAIEDVIHVPQRPKADLYENNQLIVFRMMTLVDDDVHVEQISIFVGEGWVLTFQEKPGDVLDPVRDRIRRGGGPIRGLGAGYLAYAIMDTIVDAYYPLVEEIGDRLELLEVEVLEARDARVLGELNRLRRNLLVLRRAIWPERDALSSILKEHTPFFSDKVRTYLRDTYDHAIQIADVVESYRDLAAGLMQTYLSVVGNRTNDVMKVLTIMASIFIPLTFVAGIYGMNFTWMPELQWKWGYPTVWVIMISMTAGMVMWFRRRGWL